MFVGLSGEPLYLAQNKEVGNANLVGWFDVSMAKLELLLHHFAGHGRW